MRGQRSHKVGDERRPTQGDGEEHKSGGTREQLGKNARKRARRLEVVQASLATAPGASVEQLIAITGFSRENVAKLLVRLKVEGTVVEERSPSGGSAYRLRPPLDGPTSSPEAVEAEPLEGGAKDPGQSRPPPITLKTLSDVADFLNADGATAAIAEGGRLHLGSEEVKPPSVTMRDPQALGRWVDALVAERLAGRLAESVRRELSATPRAARILSDGVVGIIGEGGVILATVKATSATIPGLEPVSGNYLGPGPHWKLLAGLLGGELLAEEQTSTGRTTVDEGIHRSLPPNTPPEVESAALEASRRLKTERTRVFVHLIRVDVASVSLTFSPLTMSAPGDGPLATPSHLELPFVAERDGDRFAGSLRLRSLGEPLACVWHQQSDADTLALAWSVALTTYAGLTCVPNKMSPARIPGGVTTRQGPRGRRKREVPRTLSLPRDHPGAFPTGFRPQGGTARYVASYVAGHRRELPAGYEHSPEAAAKAAEVGIQLRAGETWVQPHARGVPQDAVLHFSWRGPAWIGTMF